MADWPYSTARWQRLRKAKLSENPLCETCERRGRKIIAEHVDHVVSIASGGHAFPAMDGLRSLCPPCHSSKTNALDCAGGKDDVIKGCDGPTLDPDHPFLQSGPGPFRGEANGSYALDRRHCNRRGALVARWGGVASDLERARPGNDSPDLGLDHSRPDLADTTEHVRERLSSFRRLRGASGSSEPLVGDSSLEGRQAVAQGPAAKTTAHLVRDWGV